MCRILVSAYRRDSSIYRDFIEYFIRASEKDVLLEKISRYSSHGDGWGLAGIGLSSNKPVIFYQKSLLPVYHGISRDLLVNLISKTELYDETYLLIHSRLASKTEPLGEKYSHPYEERIGNKLILWFIHNGSVDKASLANTLGISDPWYYTDSWIATKYIAKNLETCITEKNIDHCIVTIYENLRKYTRSALNTGLLILYDQKPYLYASHYYIKDIEEQLDRREYYSLYAYQDQDIALIASSTIKHYSDHSMYQLEQGIYRVEPGKITLIHSF
ncbi:MAG: hypothetical protein ABWW65_06860 [Thermoprotei archaeon]